MSLYPTPVRLALLRAVLEGGVWIDEVTGKAMQTTDGGRAYVVQARIDEMARAGWVMWVREGKAGQYRITAAGRAELAKESAR